MLASGPNPAKDYYEVTLKPAAGQFAAVRLETLPDASLPGQSAARADDGGFRLSEFEAELVSMTDGKPGKVQKIKFATALADSAREKNEVATAIDGKAETGWQVDPAANTNQHAALFLPADAVTVPENALLRVRLRFEASESKRAIGRFRLALAQNEELVDLLVPPKPSAWQVIGPFPSTNTMKGLAYAYEPETAFDLKKSYPGVRNTISWAVRNEFEDGKANLLVQDLHGIHGVYYLYRTISMSQPSQMELSLRADDLFRIWVNGKQVAERTVEEKPGEAPTKVVVPLQKGENKFLVKIVTTQGAAYFTFKKSLDDKDRLPGDLAALLATTSQFSAEQKTRLRNHYFRQASPDFREVFDKVERWREENAGIEKAIPTTLVAKEMDKPRETRLLLRGEYDQKGDRVYPGVPAALSPWPTGAPTNRFGLAQWLIDPAQPLMARVTVNRFWQQFFGVGLVKTAEDFGLQGDNPSHPQLLDWLATEFRTLGWDVKKLQRLILTSATYRQSSRIAPEMLVRDPENRLLARGPRFRLDGEVLRDTALYVGGLLAEQRGGRSVKPWEPPGLWEAVSFNNSQKVRSGHWRCPIPAQPLHVLEAAKSSAQHDDL